MGNKVDTKQVKKLFKQLDGLPLDTMKKAFPFLKRKHQSNLAMQDVKRH